MILVKTNENGFFELSVKANSSKTQITSFDENKNIYKMDVAAIPDKGLANKEIIKFFKKEHKWEIEIKSGKTSSKKLIRKLAQK